MSALPVSVLIPTVGRPGLLAACLESLEACEPRPDEVVVVDQSRAPEIAALAERFAPLGTRVLTLRAPNKPLALNLGLREARNEIVLMTDDDCTVAETWIQAAWSHMSGDPDGIVTGRVLPVGDPRVVPSTIVDEAPRDYTGELHYGALYGGNMACNRSLVLEHGGFDERFPVAEDNDFCYRWLRAGRRLRYEPDLVVWHHAWRTPEQMGRLYLDYGYGQGVFYAKHLRARDPAVLRFLARDLYRGARGAVAARVRPAGGAGDPRKGLLRGLLKGLAAGWRVFGVPRAADAR